MSRGIVVAGTDAKIGKTVFSAGLADSLGANYWKPIQAGLEGETDSQFVARLGGLSDDRIVPERYRLETPASLYHAAEIDGVRIDLETLDVPDTGERPLVIEGTGGLMVPLSLGTLYIDVFARWHRQVVLCERTRWAPSIIRCCLSKRCEIGRSQFSELYSSANEIPTVRSLFVRSDGSGGLAGCPGFSSHGTHAAGRVQNLIQPR
jgi:dethiobiotin synthase